MSRRAKVDRKTHETRVAVEVDLDGTGQASVSTPIGFLSHMVEQVARHGMLDLTVCAEGDVHVDGHHTTEDLGIVLGEAVAKALGDKAHIRRHGWATLPMDEACVTCALDLSGRPFFVWRVPLPKARLGDFEVELTEVFFEAFCRTSRCNLHMRLHEGDNLHHVIEVCFKAFAKSLRMAVERDPRQGGIPSTKGVL